MLISSLGWTPSWLVLGLALLLDLAYGELPNAVHPVAWLGSAASALLKFAPTRPSWQLLFGFCVVVSLALGAAGVTLAALALCARWPLLELALQVVLFKSMFALRALGAAALDVRASLSAGQLAEAQQKLRCLCSRDASELDAADVVGASVESLAENASDSFVAPLFYYVMFGLAGSVVYRVVNTLDAMIGYRGRYEYLGKTAARLDDVLNLVPARLTALLLVLAGCFAGGRARLGLSTWLRDGGRTESPNAGRPMAAMAGLLGVELVKVGHYRLGVALGNLESRSIDSAWQLVRIAAALAATLAALALGVRHVYFE